MKNLIASLALAAAATGMGSGCAVFEPSLETDNQVKSDQQYSDLAEIVKAANGNLDKLVSDLSEETVKEPALNEDGSPMIAPDGTPLYRTRTRKERGFPLAPSRTQFSAGSKFVEAKLKASIHNNADGASMDFNHESSPDSETFGIGAANQGHRTDGGYNALANLGAAAFGHLNFRAQQETIQKQNELASEDFRAGLAAQHGESEGIAAPEAPAAPEPPQGVNP